MTRRERIVVLLDYFRDVEEGFADRGFNDEKVRGMCRAWNHPSYRQLRAQLAELMHADWKAWHHLSIRYTRWTQTKRIAFCQKCGEHPAHAVGSSHKHGPGRRITLEARTVWLRRGHNAFDAERGVDWIESKWDGDAILPPEILANVSKTKLAGVA